jgi:hypothetical protein
MKGMTRNGPSGTPQRPSVVPKFARLFGHVHETAQTERGIHHEAGQRGDSTGFFALQHVIGEGDGQIEIDHEIVEARTQADGRLVDIDPGDGQHDILVEFLVEGVDGAVLGFDRIIGSDRFGRRRGAAAQEQRTHDSQDHSGPHSPPSPRSGPDDGIFPRPAR